MVQYDYKNINVVPIGNEFVDLTHHHQVPNVLHKGLKIDRLCKFYTHEVKQAELGFRKKLSTIISEFPLLEEIHPLHIDLLGLVFDRDRYKLALGQVNTAKILITNIANHYVKLLKFSESLKQCKKFKVDASRSMFSVVNEITPSLAYLEQIRTHIVKLPSIDPNTRTLLVCGYPHVDKTCFMYSFRTGAEKSVSFVVGHVDYKGSRYQVIDAPGVLDRPVFGECNVITALACHLRDAIVLFFLDVSGSCGYSIAHQVAFFYCLKSLFGSKPLLVVCNETDLMQVCDQDWNLIEEMCSGMGEYDDEEVGFEISNPKTEEGVVSVKNVACKRLLDQRERLSSLTLEEAKIMRNEYILANQEPKQDEIIPQSLDDDSHNDSELSQDSEVLFKPEELVCNQESKEDETIPQHLDDDGHKDSDLLADSEVLFKHEELEYGKAHKQAKDSDLLVDSEVLVKPEEELECEDEGHKQAKYEVYDFVIAEDKFTKEYKDQLVATRKMIIAFAFFLLVGNSYGAIQQCLYTLCF